MMLRYLVRWVAIGVILSCASLSVARDVGVDEANQYRLFQKAWPIEVAHIDRAPGTIASAIVGIVVSNGDVRGGDGTGFLVDACHVMTSNHVVVAQDGTPWSDVWIGIDGASPNNAGSPEAPSELTKKFMTVTKARPEWFGGSPTVAKDFGTLSVVRDHRQRLDEDDFHLSLATSGDWAILKLNTCVAADHSVIALPKKPYRAIDSGMFHDTLDVFGYPGAKFGNVTKTTCFPQKILYVGTELDCRVYPGNSGGPVLLQRRDGSYEAISILSYISVNDSLQGVRKQSGIADATSTFTAAAVLQNGFTSIRDASCSADIRKRLGLPADPDNDNSLTAPLTPAVQREFLKEASEFGNRMHDVVGSYIPAAPDKFWCETLQSKGDGLAADVAGFIGDWHFENQAGIKVYKSNGRTLVDLTGDGLINDHALSKFYGHRAYIVGHTENPAPIMGMQTTITPVAYVVDFNDRTAPFLVSDEYGGEVSLDMVPFSKGAIYSRCEQYRQIYQQYYDNKQFNSKALDYNHDVEAKKCPGPKVDVRPDDGNDVSKTMAF